MSGCLVLREKDTIDFFERQYNAMYAHTRNLDIEHGNIEGKIDVTKLIVWAESAAEINYFPCITFAFTEEMLENHITLEENEKKQIISWLCSTNECVKQKINWKNFCSERGIREFLETGIIPVYPESIYKRPDLSVRLAIMKGLIDLIKKGTHSIYIANEEKLYIDPSIAIEYNDKGNVWFHWLEKGEFGKTISMEEPGISESFQVCEKFMLESKWFYSREDSLARIEEICREYEEKQ